MRVSSASGALVAVLVLSSCSAPTGAPVATGGSATANATTTATAAPSPDAGTSKASAAGPGPSASQAPAPSGPATPASATTPTPRVAATTDAPHATPYTVKGVALVNRRHPLASTYVPSWASDPNGLSPEFTAALKLMTADAAKQGLTLKVRSGYRSYAAQKTSYESALKQYGAATADSQFALPGASEHQTGLACDLTDASGGPGYAFKGTPEADYVAQHATDFGFVVRYPEGKQAITGYIWEPWHIRYVGKQVSSYFAAHPGLTLEEYLGDA